MRRDRISRGASGFTLVELLILLVSLSILAALARPVIQRFVLDSRAERILEDLTTVREAVLDFRLRYDRWPPEEIRGRVPRGLEEFLPPGFSFQGPEYVLDYDLWSGRDGAILDAVLAFYSADREVGRAVMELLGSQVWTDGQTRFAWALQE